MASARDSPAPVGGTPENQTPKRPTTGWGGLVGLRFVGGGETGSSETVCFEKSNEITFNSCDNIF